MKGYISGKDGKVYLCNALNNEIIIEFESVSEAVIFAVKNNYVLPEQSFDGKFLKDENGFIYFNGKDFEYANGELLLNIKRCNNCGWFTIWKEILDEDKNQRECYVCPNCSYTETCTPPVEDITEGD